MTKLIAVAWQARRLSRLVKSRTTKDQLAGNTLLLLVLCAIAAGISQFVEVETDVLIVAVTTALTFLSPVAARVVAFVHKEFDVPPETMLIRVRKEGRMWKKFSGSLQDARLEGWIQGVLMDGMLVDIKHGRKLGRVLRLPNSETKKD